MIGLHGLLSTQPKESEGRSCKGCCYVVCFALLANEFAYLKIGKRGDWTMVADDSDATMFHSPETAVHYAAPLGLPKYVVAVAGVP